MKIYVKQNIKHKRHNKLKRTFRQWYQNYAADQMLCTRRAEADIIFIL